MSHPALPETSTGLESWIAHPGWDGRCLIGAPGYTPPEPDRLEPVLLTELAVPALAARGIVIEGAIGTGNLVWLPKDGTALRVRLRFSGRPADNNVLVVGSTKAMNMTVTFGGPGNLVVFSGGINHVGTSLTMRGSRAAVFWGRNTSSNHTNILAHGPARSVQIGDEGMFAEDITVRTADSHGMIDLARPDAITNPPASCVIEPYVWLQSRCVVMKGMRVGRGAIVGASALVTHDVPPRTLVVGVPARVLRDGVTWTREQSPGPAALRRAVAWAEGAADTPEREPAWNGLDAAAARP